jgi:NAD(P)-dependent dehydrogenase (short-subunit alcohol dehydrogenase family)
MLDRPPTGSKMKDKLINSIKPGLVVMITAGASGIGRVIAETFLSHGSRVHVCDIDPSAIDDFSRINPGAGTSVTDVADIGMVDELFDELDDRYGHLDVLVNGSGIAGPTVAVENVDPADWDHTIAVNLNGHFYCARRAIPLLKKSGGGSIISISSSAGLMGCPMRAPYVASKWALIGLTKTLAMELGPGGIRVNAICPASVEGERIERLMEQDARERGLAKEQVRQAYMKQTSLRRFVSAQDVANMALFLASDLAKSISGAAMRVDGHTESLSDVLS